MAQTLQLLSIIAFAVAGVCLVLAVFFWFFFKIPTVMGDLSGRTARKSIAKMRAANEKNGNKSYKESTANIKRGEVTGTIPGKGKSKKKDGNPETGLLTENKAEGLESEATALLDETTAILGSETTGLLVDENATAPLDTEKTTPAVRTNYKRLEMIEEVMIIHTDEVI